MKLLSQNVENLFKECLSENGTLIEGVIVKAKLNITGHEEDIMSLLLQLPENFYNSKGGGWSFLCANETKDGIEWTGLHTTVEKLIVLGIAAGKVKYLISKNLWQTLPGEMPYFVILDKIEKASHE